MDLTFVSLLAFFITTLLYFYYFKLPLKLSKSPIYGSTVKVDAAAPVDTLQGQTAPSLDEMKESQMIGGGIQKGGTLEGANGEEYKTYGDYATSNMSRLLMFFVIVVMEQFGFNLATILDKCGGTVGKNIASSLLLTVVPWSLVFGAVIMLLIVYPGLKSAFSDVVGYFFVYREADEILGSIIVDTDIDETIKKAQAEDEKNNGKQTTEMKKAAEAIMKMCGNKGILINTMNPENYEDIWTVLKPLMAPMDEEVKENYKSKLFDLIITKDNVGEAMWYIYTGLFLTSVVSFNMISRGCEKNVSTMKAEYNKYLEKNKPESGSPADRNDKM